MQATTDTSVPSQVTAGQKVLSATRHCTNCVMKNPSPERSQSKDGQCCPCPIYRPWHTCSEGLRLHCYWLTSLQIPTRKALHKPAGNNMCRPQAGRTRTPPHSETTPLPTATCPRQGTLAEDQREGLIMVVGCHSYYCNCNTQSIIIIVG